MESRAGAYLELVLARFRLRRGVQKIRGENLLKQVRQGPGSNISRLLQGVGGPYRGSSR